MLEYSIRISDTAQRQLNKLDDHNANPIIIEIQKLALNPRPPGCKKLKGRGGYRV